MAACRIFASLPPSFAAVSRMLYTPVSAKAKEGDGSVENSVQTPGFLPDTSRYCHLQEVGACVDRSVNCTVRGADPATGAATNRATGFGTRETRTVICRTAASLPPAFAAVSRMLYTPFSVKVPEGD
jgi:hypothetical protein